MAQLELARDIAEVQAVPDRPVFLLQTFSGPSVTNTLGKQFFATVTSPLVQAIAGLHRSVRGAITVDGADLVCVLAHRVGDHGVALVPEGRRVFARMTVHDNLVLGAYRRGARPGLSAGLERVHALFPWLVQPRLLLMDEPSLGLAPVVVDEVFDAIRTIHADGVIVLLVEQDVERALEVSARGYVLAEGRIVASGSSAELTGSALVRRSVLGL